MATFFCVAFMTMYTNQIYTRNTIHDQNLDTCFMMFEIFFMQLTILMTLNLQIFLGYIVSLNFHIIKILTHVSVVHVYLAINLQYMFMNLKSIIVMSSSILVYCPIIIQSFLFFHMMLKSNLTLRFSFHYSHHNKYVHKLMILIIEIKEEFWFSLYSTRFCVFFTCYSITHKNI